MSSNSPDEGEGEGESGELLLSQEMRRATKSIHSMSDHLVNAKLGVTMSDDSVWAEGLLVFYPVFKTLESAVSAHSDSLLGDLLLPGVARAKAIEADLDSYLGEGWQEGQERPQVQAYCAHLHSLEDSNPYLLVPYVYHLYMALLSGGQVMKAKRSLGGGGGSMQVFDFGEKSFGSLKKAMKGAVNDIGRQLDQETLDLIIKESVEVFRWNNTIISSVEGVDRVLRRRTLKAFIALSVLVLFFLAWWHQAREEKDTEEGRAVEL